MSSQVIFTTGKFGDQFDTQAPMVGGPQTLNMAEGRRITAVAGVLY